MLIYFRQEIWEIISTWTRSLFVKELRGHWAARMGWYVIVGTLPIAILGLALKDQIETSFRDLRLVGTTLIVFAVVLWFADHTARNKLTLEKHLSFTHAIIYGFAQSLALVPGVSRSGGTVTAGLLLDYRREDAAKYSFLLAIPAVLASGGAGAGRDRRGPGPRLGPHHPGHGHLVPRRLRGGGLVPALHQHPPLHRLRHLPHRARLLRHPGRHTGLDSRSGLSR
ncbi:hypothetical protein GCM10020001_053830 [Nonomuraea salmonea]